MFVSRQEETRGFDSWNRWNEPGSNLQRSRLECKDDTRRSLRANTSSLQVSKVVSGMNIRSFWGCTLVQPI